MEKCSKNS